MARIIAVGGHDWLDNPLIQWREQLSEAREQDRHRALGGRLARLQKRQREKRKVEEIALAAVVKYLPRLLEATSRVEPTETAWFDGQWSQLVKKLPSVYRSHTEVKDGLCAILSRLQTGNERGCWTLPLSAIPLTLERLPLPYDVRWFSKAKRCVQAQQHWYQQLAQRPARAMSDTLLLSDILHSAVFHSGVHHLDVLHGFLLAVANKSKLVATPEQVWLPLTLERCTLATNEYTDESVAETQCRVFLAMPTVGLIYRWYRRRNADVTLVVPPQREQFLSWARAYLVPPVRSLPELCQGASLVCASQPGVRWPQILSHVATGELQSAALPHQLWLSLHHPRVGDGTSVHAGTVMPANIDVASEHVPRGYHGQARPYSSLLARLRTVLAEKQVVNKKNTAKACIAGLSALLADHSFSKPEHILIGWLLASIRDRRNKPSTLRSYLSRGGKQWLSLCFGQDLTMWEGEQFLTGYRALLETYQGSKVFRIDADADDEAPEALGDTNASEQDDRLPESAMQRNVSYMAARLSSLHHFACINYQLAPLPEDLVSRVRQRPHVRASYISEVAFNELLRSLGASGTEANERLSVLYTIAFRAGLRLSEVIKLRLKDIERSNERWIYIRDTQLDDGKSDSATRKIPLGVLLTDQEQQRLDAYLAPLWGRMQKHANALVFASADGVLIPLKVDEVTEPLTSRLFQLTGQKYTFHHLRHSALSRLQLVLHHQVLGLHQLPGWQHFLPWTEDQCARIYRTITQISTTQSDYWALAQLAGHQSPETTLNSYLHFSDWVSAAYLRQAVYDWPQALRGQFTGMSQAKLTSAGWFDGPLSWARCSRELLQAITPWTQPIRWQVSPLPPQQPITKRKLDFNATLTLLRMMAGREDLSAMYARYDITKALVDELLHKARLLRSLRTQRKHTRLIRTKYPWLALAPGALRSHAENAELNHVVDKARKVFRTQKTALIGWVKYVLRHSNTHNAGLPFTKPADLTAFLSVTLQLMPASHVDIVLTCQADAERITRWKQAVGERNVQLSMEKTKASNSRALLRIRHPDEQGIRQRATKRHPDSQQFEKYSTPLLRSVAFVLAIKLMTVEEIRQLAK